MGNQHSLDTFSNDLVENLDAVEGEKSMYTAYGEDSDKDKSPMLSFCFGKAVASELGRLRVLHFSTIATTATSSFCLTGC